MKLYTFHILILVMACSSINGIVYGQYPFFTKDSIPIEHGRVVFEREFTFDFNKEALNTRINLFLSKQFNPVTGEIMENNTDYTLCSVVDYIDIGDNIFHSYGIYMIYLMRFDYDDGRLQLAISDIFYLEKGYIDAFLDPSNQRNFPKYTAREIMMDHALKQLFVRNVSKRITENSIKRINQIIHDLSLLFGKEFEMP